MKVGLIAGEGDFPLEVAQSISQKNIEVFIVALKNIASKDIERYPHIWVRMANW